MITETEPGLVESDALRKECTNRYTVPFFHFPSECGRKDKLAEMAETLVICEKAGMQEHVKGLSHVLTECLYYLSEEHMINNPWPPVTDPRILSAYEKLGNEKSLFNDCERAKARHQEYIALKDDWPTLDIASGIGARDGDVGLSDLRVRFDQCEENPLGCPDGLKNIITKLLGDTDFFDELDYNFRRGGYNSLIEGELDGSKFDGNIYGASVAVRRECLQERPAVD